MSPAELSKYRLMAICLQSCRSCMACCRGLSSDFCSLSCTLPISASAKSSHSTVFPCTSTLTTIKCQVCLSLTVNDTPTSVDRFARCIEDVDAWLSVSRLRLNPTKTKVLWLCSRYLVDRITVRHLSVLSSSVQVVDSARDLSVVIDSDLTMADHVTAVCRAAYFHLRQLRLITRSLTVDVAMTFVQTFISCYLDYCNSVQWHYRQSAQAPPVGPECGRATCHRHSSM